MPPQPGEGTGYVWYEPEPFDQPSSSGGSSGSTRLSDMDPDEAWQTVVRRSASELAGQVSPDITAQLESRERLAGMSSSDARSAQRASQQAANRSYQLQKRQLEQQQKQFEAQLAQELELQRAAHALNWLSQASQLRGPSDWIQASNFARGSRDLGAPVALEALASGIGGTLNQFGQSAGTPDPLTMGSLFSKLGVGGGGIPGEGDTGRLDALADQIGQNPQNAALGSAEALTGDERGMLGSLLENKGFSMPTWIDMYRRSRPGQGSALSA